jgi:hypothetical protein
VSVIRSDKIYCDEEYERNKREEDVELWTGLSMEAKKYWYFVHLESPSFYKLWFGNKRSNSLLADHS